VKSLPILRTRYATGFLRGLDQLGLPAGASLSRAGLNDGILRDSDNWMPLHQLGQFLEHVSQRHGCWELGQVAGLLPRRAHSDFSMKVLHAPTLNQSLTTLSKFACKEDTSAHFTLIPNGQGTWLDCGSVQGSVDMVAQVELYRLGALVEVVREYAGPNWLPRFINLQSSDDYRIQGNDLLRKTNVHFGAGSLSFLIDAPLLSLSPQKFEKLANRDVRLDDSDLGRYSVFEFTENLKAVLNSRLGQSDVGITAVAQKIGMSSRSLQRQLARHGTSFSELLDQTRIDTAQSLLNETEEPHHEIARSLGYQHTAHFSRAFRRVCGVSPRQYRQLQKS